MSTEMTVMRLAELLAKPANILVVEDDPLTQDLMRDALRAIGCEVTIIGDGNQAFNALKERQFDGVLLDIRLPGISGVELVRKLREHHIKVPIVVITGFPDPEIESLIDAYGVLAVVTKPIAYDELVVTLKRYLEIFKVKTCEAKPDESANPS